MTVARDAVDAFKTMNLRIGGKSVGLDGNHINVEKLSVKSELWNDQKYEANFAGTPEQMANFIELQTFDNDIPVYSTRWPPGTTFRMILAAAMGLFVQWGTTGSAIVIAY